MSTEWIQIIIVIGIIVPLAILTGRYLYWRRWDKERRINRLARRQGFAMRNLDYELAVESDNPIAYWPLPKNPGFLSDSGHSVKA